MKAMKNLLWMAALTLTAATLTACSNEEEPAIKDKPVQKGNVVTLTATLQPQSTATRGVLTENGDGSISAEWKEGDRLSLYYSSSDGYISGEAVVTAVDPTTKTATIRAELTNPSDGGWIDFNYPYNKVFNTETNPNIYNGQKGTLADIGANWVSYYGSAQMSVVDGKVSLSGSISMSANTCIWKFSFIDGSTNITSSITKLTIACGNNSYVVTPSNQNAIYVSMDYMTNQNVYLIARSASNVYTKTHEKKISLKSGDFYTSTNLAMTRVKSMTEATTDDIGRVIGQDGMIYENDKIATACGTTAVAMIAYVGNTGCEHGLAVALQDESTEQLHYDVAFSTCAAKTPVLTANWRLPTSQDWQNMFIGCGSESSQIPNGALNNGSQIDCMYFGIMLGKVGTMMTYDRDYWTATKTGSKVEQGGIYYPQFWLLKFNFRWAQYSAGIDNWNGFFTRAVLSF